MFGEVFFCIPKKKALTPASKVFILLSWRTSAPRNTLYIIMINKIKKAIVGAVLSSDTFKSTLEKVVSEEVQVCVDHNDDLVTDDRLDRALRDLGYDYDIPDSDGVREIVSQELDECHFIDSSEAEDIALALLKAEDIQVCSAEKLRVACLRTLANLVESAE